MVSLPPGYSLHTHRGLGALPATTLHAIARLRQEVFVVEQECAYLDLDGRDAEDSTRQYWIEHTAQPPLGPGIVVTTLRVLDESAREPRLHAIGRVATAAQHRGLGLAAALMRAVIDDYGADPLELEAQSHLTDWYAQFGFAANGAEYLEDGIPHTPMRRS